jgi:hypothetical protein
MRRAAANAVATADALLAWLRTQSGGDGTAVGAASEGRPPEAASARGRDGVPDAGTREAAAAAVTAGEDTSARHGASRPEAKCRAATMRLAHTDWLHHRLTISGATDQLTGFRRAAAGAGIIPWRIDLDRMEEDVFHLLAAPPRPQLRTLSVSGARVLARQLRAAIGGRHDRAVARVGVSQACPFDLHTLVPVIDRVLQLGPDDPAALAWLWEHWGTTEPLRHVAADIVAGQEARARAGLATEHDSFRVTFWSADWTPWRALRALAERWPGLCFDLRPTYGGP